MDALTIIIMLILFIIAMIFVFSTALLTPYLGKKNLITVVLLGLVVGAVGGAFLLSPIVDDIPDFSRTIIEENIEGTDHITMGLSTNRNLTQLIENISSISGVQNVAYDGIIIRMDEPFDSQVMKTNFLTKLQNSNKYINGVDEMENNTYFIKIKEGGDPQSILDSIYEVFDTENYVHLRYTSMDANATVSANNVTKIMNTISDSGAVIKNVTGPTEDQVSIINKYTPNKTDVVIIAAIFGVVVSLVGFFIDSLNSMRKRRKTGKKQTTKEQIKRKTVPKSQHQPPNGRRRHVPKRESIDVFNEDFENSEKQHIGSNHNFKQLTKEDNLKEKPSKKQDVKDEPKTEKKSLFGRLKRSKNDKKRNDKKEENKSKSQRKAPKIRPKKRE